MRLFELDNRLALCASFVRQGATLADIGTDHAYLPIWLVSNGVVTKALACDINEGPLNAGKADVERYSLSDKITLRLSDGLKKVKENEAEDIVIAGMGGELIAKILRECTWAKNSSKRFILQPMTKCEVLIRWLYENGFEILEQKACESDKKHYTVLHVQYTGDTCYVDNSFFYIGKLDPKDKASKLYLEHIISHLKKRAIGDESLFEVIEKIKGMCNL
ncbi:MAG: SAM-dependent methyltransferase [Ruminococcaceae bacterium]|nr:SAM-dependent methyltransferase [Oscillospiraceae bacterium]